MKKLLFVSFLLFSVSGLYAQGVQNFLLINSTGLSIDQLFVSPANVDNWEEDILGVDILENGAECEISFDISEEACLWDILIVDADGDEIVWEDLNLCEISEINLYWEDGKAWAELK